MMLYLHHIILSTQKQNLRNIILSAADERGVLKVSGYEWAILRLGHTGTVHELEIDTHHFKGNFPDSCRVDGCLLPLDADPHYIKEKAVWKTILPTQKVGSKENYNRL